MNILGTHYNFDGSCVINAEIDEVERQFLIEYALTKIIKEYIEELSEEPQEGPKMIKEGSVVTWQSKWS